jgi:hypothetical protein
MQRHAEELLGLQHVHAVREEAVFFLFSLIKRERPMQGKNFLFFLPKKHQPLYRKKNPPNPCETQTCMQSDDCSHVHSYCE